MLSFSFDRARDSLARLLADFEQGGRRHPHLRHVLVLAPRVREVDDRELPPRSSMLSLEGRDDVCEFPIAGEAPQTHYYVGLDPRKRGADLSELRNLASRAALILEGWPSGAAGYFVLPVRFAQREAAEAWMAIVHQLAWKDIPSQELRAELSHPMDSWEAPWEVGSRDDSAIRSTPEIASAADIPPDCRMSSLPDVSVSRACSWAIRLLIKEMGTVQPFKPIDRHPAEDDLARLLSGFLRHDRDYRDRVRGEFEGNRWEDGEKRWLAKLQGVLERVESVRNWPHRAGLDWLDDMYHAAAEIHANYPYWMKEDDVEASGPARDLPGGGDSDAVVKPAWLPDPDLVRGFEVARRRLLGDSIVDEAAGGPEINPHEDPTPPEPTQPSPSAASEQRPCPEWNRSERTLKCGEKTKAFRGDAANAMKLLDAFENMDWPQEVRNPFGDDAEKLKNTIKQMRKMRSKTNLDFSMVNLRVRWSLADRNPSESTP